MDSHASLLGVDDGYMLDPIPSKRVYLEDGSSHIEPPFEGRSDMDRLRILAGQVEADTGVKIRFGEASSWTNGIRDTGKYAYSYKGCVGSGRDFYGTWYWLTGILTGYKFALKNGD